MAPFKRQRQPKMTTQALLDFDLGDESSSDSDFRIDDLSDDDNSKDDNSSSDGKSSSGGDSDADSENNFSEDSTQQLKLLLADATDENVKGVNACSAESKTKKGEELKKAKHEVANGVVGLQDMLRKFESQKEEIKPKVSTKPICCVCLGDRSDDSNEIVECDGCGVSVHEGCYGVSDNTSISSTNSTCSTEPWFCEACRAGVTEPTCELCPNTGGIYKETDVGKWVHLVCALYVPGVAFGEVDQLSCVTLFEMQYSKWGGKACSLCENSRFARTGVCIGCDAGMCKSFFHVTCGQAAGFLTEAHHEDTDTADPFYAHCKVHSEKELMKKRKRNYYTFRLNMEQKQKERFVHTKKDDPCPDQMRINRKLQKYQIKYAAHKQARPQPWVPTQKMPRLLTTSASACRRLMTKANIMEVNVDLLERQEAQVAALTDIRKKWHIAPAFSVEFVAYYIDRIARTKELKEQLTEMVSRNSVLTKEQSFLRTEYDSLLDKNKDLKEQQLSLIDAITQLQKNITSLCPSKTLVNPLSIGNSQDVNEISATTPPTRPISVPTAAALKMGVGFPLAHLKNHLNSKGSSHRLLSTHDKHSPNALLASSTPSVVNSMLANSATLSHLSTVIYPTCAAAPVTNYDCGICKKSTNQHLLAKCDTCKLHYHLGCLNPPLTRHPKKSKLYGWQCSECDKSDQEDAVSELPQGPRKSRTRFNKDGLIVPVCKITDVPITPPSPKRMEENRFQNDCKKVADIAVIAAAANNLACQPQQAKKRSLDNTSKLSQNNCTTPTNPLSPSLSPVLKKKFNKSLPISRDATTPTATTSLPSNQSNLENEENSSMNIKRLSKKSKLSLNYIRKSKDEQELQPHEQIETTTMKKTSLLPKKNPKMLALADMPKSPLLIRSPIDEPLVSVISPKMIQHSSYAAAHLVSDATDPLALPTNLTAGTACNSNELSALEDIVTTDSSIAKQARKQKRKDKHKSKHNSASEQSSPNKEHKRKRKKKHDMEAPNDTMAGIPKIKIKFKTLPLPGEVTPEAQFFYVSADMVRSADEASRPGSVETVEDNNSQHSFVEHDQNISPTPRPPSLLPPTSPLLISPKIILTPTRPSAAVTATAAAGKKSSAAKSPVTPARTITTASSSTVSTATSTPTSSSLASSPRKVSPRKLAKARSSMGTLTASGGRQKSATAQVLICCICQMNGQSSNAVTCDECHKHYHFTCLDPPLKKSPKIRGYSWHCADCDPSDLEKH